MAFIVRMMCVPVCILVGSPPAHGPCSRPHNGKMPARGESTVVFRLFWLGLVPLQCATSASPNDDWRSKGSIGDDLPYLTRMLLLVAVCGRRRYFAAHSDVILSTFYTYLSSHWPLSLRAYDSNRWPDNAVKLSRLSDHHHVYIYIRKPSVTTFGRDARELGEWL